MQPTASTSPTSVPDTTEECLSSCLGPMPPSANWIPSPPPFSQTWCQWWSPSLSSNQTAPANTFSHWLMKTTILFVCSFFLALEIKNKPKQQHNQKQTHSTISPQPHILAAPHSLFPPHGAHSNLAPALVNHFPWGAQPQHLQATKPDDVQTPTSLPSQLRSLTTCFLSTHFFGLFWPHILMVVLSLLLLLSLLCS